MSVSNKTEEKPIGLGFLVLFIIIDAALFFMVAVGSSMIGDRSMGHGIQIIANAILIPIMWCFFGVLLSRK